jgi:succinyl-CoA synthetase beta subunit
MNLHEYQAKSLLAKFGVPLLRGYLAYTPREAQKAAANLGGGICVVKAQIHAGGRGKGGGVKLAKSPAEAHEAAQKIIGMNLVSPQTGPEGRLVRKVWVEEGAKIKREFYLSLLVDRAESGVCFIASREGGMEIEEVAAHSPEKILRVLVRPEAGLQDFHVRQIGYFLGLESAQLPKLAAVIRGLYLAFLTLDSSLLEINPLIETEGGDFICLDAKMSIDDNALYRQVEAHRMLDYDEIDERELRAGEVGISYVALDGNIGCMVNGAGLAMATMDIIKEAGGKPANFLDVGGGASREQVTEALKLILKDSAVKGIFINIFGGIMRCDVIAGGVIQAAKDLKITVPLVVRLQGTNVDLGKKMLADSGLKIIAADDMAEAAKKIVEAVKQ